MNNKGFTLVEALAVIVVLGLVLSIGGFSVASYLNNSREKTLNVFKENIKSGMINCYNECKYLKTEICNEGIFLQLKEDPDDENKITGYKLSSTIGSLAEYGFLENQGSDEEGNALIIKNPVTDDDITDCTVEVTYNRDSGNFSIDINGGALTDAGKKAICNSADLDYK